MNPNYMYFVIRHPDDLSKVAFTNQPTKVHRDRFEADAEAVRLARSNPGIRFIVALAERQYLGKCVVDATDL